MTTPPPNRIVHLHIPKTAGVAFRTAFERAFDGGLRSCPFRYEREFAGVDLGEYNFFSGHIGYDLASRIGDDVITLLREPIDRFLSTYCFLRHRYLAGNVRNERTSLIARYDLDQLVLIEDEPVLIPLFQNSASWQLAHGHTMWHRRALLDQGTTDADILRRAIENTTNCAVVGLQHRMDAFVARINARYGIDIRLEAVNVTPDRLSISDIGRTTLSRIERWLTLDLELYQYALEHF